MQILQNAGDFKILATWPSIETNKNAQMVLEKAGRTCYQSEKLPITPESATKFCTNLLKRTHYSIFEHGWRGYIISPIYKNQEDPNSLIRNILFHFWPITKFMFITQRLDGSVLISANLETWRKCFSKNSIQTFSYKIMEDLENFAPIVFPKSDKENKYHFNNNYNIEPITSIEQLESDEEILNHTSFTILYDKHSRGFTHELVRHRLAAYSQESTRYVDEKDFEYILPPHKDKEESNSNFLLASISNTYKILRKSLCWRPEDARQILPTALVAQIVMSSNLKYTRYMLFRRTSEFAHWEIRGTMIKVLNHFKTIFPKIFDMFEYTDEPANDSIKGYFKFSESASFFCND